jgi:hypothetical protein
VDFMQVVGSADDHRIRTGVTEQIFDVVESVADREPLGEGPSLGEVIVAYADDGHVIESREHGEVGDLGNGARTDNADPHPSALVLPPARREAGRRE